MKKIFLFFITFSIISSAARAEIIKASVNGLVCAFCATGIEKTFNAQPEVDKVKVDLESKLVIINTKKDKTIDDAKCTKLLTDAGYSVTNITREK